MKRRQTKKKFLELLEPIKDSLHGYAQRAVWRKDQVPDVVQEAFMTGWREFDRFEQGTNFRAWMFRVLVNTVFRFNKKGKRRREVELEEFNVDTHATFQREEAWSMLLDQPEALSDLLDERLVYALDRLGEDERQCLLLRLLESFSYKEIASLLEIPLGTVMSHVHRARMKLREDLAELAVERRLVREAAL